MTRRHALYLGIAVLIAVVGIFIARNTTWDEIVVQNPPRGPALEDPYYASKELLHHLGLSTGQLVSLRQLPPRDGVLLAPDIGDETLRTVLGRVERWVEGGGRLIVSGNDIWSSPGLQSWSGIAPASRSVPEAQQKLRPVDPCGPLAERVNGVLTGDSLRACIRNSEFSFDSRRTPAWSLSNVYGMQMLRVAIGRGSITVLECQCLLKNSSVLREDHARILFAAVPLRRGERFSFTDLTEAESLAALLWRLAAPALVVAAAALALAIWRGWSRFGPLEPVVAPVRRSLAEQIRANASFAWRTRQLASLQRAVRRAVERVAQRRIVAYQRLDSRARIDAIAQRTGQDADAVRAAFSEPVATDAAAQSAAIELLERVRRNLALGSTRI